MQPARWYRLSGDDVVGPFGLADLRAAIVAGELGPEDVVWADGMPDWLRAADVPALVPPRRLRPGTRWADGGVEPPG